MVSKASHLAKSKDPVLASITGGPARSFDDTSAHIRVHSSRVPVKL
jgi:hypothetical protein